MIRMLLTGLAGLLASASVACAGAPTTQPTNERATVGHGLMAVATAKDATDSQLRTAAMTARDALPDSSQARRRLEDQLSKPDGSIDRRVLERVARDVSFTPVMEAPTPRGWPTYTPVGELELKQYPSYRMAYVDRDAVPGGGQFMTLFFHIQRNEIAMTAPVEMTMSADARDRNDMSQMAFLYENVDMGQLGLDGKVRVVDVPRKQALSIGGRGDWSARAIADARARFDAWLADHPTHEPDGDLRVMGYNSPSMPREKRYHEIQLPVREKLEGSP
jgi:hypothetical protein